MLCWFLKRCFLVVVVNTIYKVQQLVQFQRPNFEFSTQRVQRFWLCCVFVASGCDMWHDKGALTIDSILPVFLSFRPAGIAIDSSTCIAGGECARSRSKPVPGAPLLDLLYSRSRPKHQGKGKGKLKLKPKLIYPYCLKSKMLSRRQKQSRASRQHSIV